MTTPRRSNRAQTRAPNYKEKPEVEDEFERSEDEVEATAVNEVKSQTSKKVKRKASDARLESEAKTSKESIPVRGSLLDTVRGHADSIPMATIQWWEEDSQDSPKAVSKLINMLLQACGCLEPLEEIMFSGDRDIDEDVKSIENSDTIKSILTAKDKQGKKFKLNMAEFWRKFIMNASEENMSKIHEHSFLRWVFALSTSSLRDIRYGSCFAATEMMHASLDRAQEIVLNMSKYERLVHAGTNKARNKELLNSQLQLKIVVEKFMDQLFTSVLIHRQRDVDADIRALFIACMGNCISKYKVKFFDNSYLKYLGWSLNDKDHIVRAIALDSLIELYGSDQVTELEMFTNRFLDRIIQMRLDVNNEAAYKAMELLHIMCRNSLIPVDRYEDMYKMLVDSAANVRQSAAAFVDTAYLKGQLLKEFASEIDSSETGSHLVKGLIEMITSVIGSDIHETAIRDMLEALLPYLPRLQEWNLICDILMEDGDKDELAPDDKAMLAKFMLAALQLAQEDSDSRSIGKVHKVGKTKHAEGSLLLCKVLPSLLKRFSADNDIIISLIRVPIFLNFEALTEQQSKCLIDAIDVIVDVASKSQDSSILLACSDCLQTLSSSEFPSNGAVRAKIGVFLDSVRSDFKKMLDGLHQSFRGTATQTLKIKRPLLLCSNLDIFEGNNDIIEDLGEALKMIAKDVDSTFPQLAGRYLVSLACQAVLWSAKQLFHAQDSDDSSVDASSVVKMRDFIIECLIEIVAENTHIAIRLQAVSALADISQVYGMRQESRQWSNAVSKQLGCYLHIDAMKVMESSVRPILAGTEGIPENMAETLNKEVLDPDNLDPTGLHKFFAIALVKVVMYCKDNSEEAAMVMKEVLATIGLHVPYSSDFNQQLHQSLSRKIDDWRIWLSSHEEMYERVLKAAVDTDTIQELSSTMIDAVGATYLSPSAVDSYLIEGFKFALKSMPGNLGFLDILSLHVKKLSKTQAKTVLDNIHDLCLRRKINITFEDDTSPAQIVKFMQKIQEIYNPIANLGGSNLSGNLKSPESVKSVRRSGPDVNVRSMTPHSGSTPVKASTQIQTETLEFSPESNNEDSPKKPDIAAQTAKKQSDSRKASSSKGKAAKRKLEEEVDDEGFMATRRRNK